MNLFIFAIFCSTTALAYTADFLLRSDEILTYESGRVLISENGQYRLNLQSDGNLVVYNVPTGHHVWDTYTHDSGATKAWMRPDGDLWLMKGSEIKWRSLTRWPGSYLKLENDGKLVIYKPNSIFPMWINTVGIVWTPWGTEKK